MSQTLSRGKRGAALALACAVSTALPVHAQFAVIDVGAIAQLIAQAQTLEQELAVTRSELSQAQAQYAAITGDRGMERLLANAPRNYLPQDWPGLQSAMQGGAPLGYAVAANVQANAALSPQIFATLSPAARQEIDAERQLASLAQVLSRDALATTSARFASLSELTAAIPGARDEKAVLDLQARVLIEGVLLQNEQTKLATLHRVIDAQQQAADERLRELALGGHGAFSTRFHPTP